MTDSTIIEIATVFPENTDLKLHRRRSIIKEFSLNTSTHGIPGIARSESIHNRIFWTISLLCFTGIMIYFITESIRAYFTYSTQTVVSIEDEWPQTFAAVTICNYSPVRYDLFKEPFLNYLFSQNLTNETTEITIEHAQYIQEFMRYKLNTNNSLNEYYFQLNDMLISCNYNGIECTSDDFISFVTQEYGRCYTFNAQNDRIRNGSIFYNTDNGKTGLLKIYLYSHSQQYVPYLSDAVGFIAMIHDNRDIPFIDVAGIYLGPGQKHRVTYTTKKQFILGSPYSDCTDKVPDMLQAVANTFGGTNYAYKQNFCFTVCAQVYTYSQCGCINPYQWSVRMIILPGTTNIIEAPLCNLTDKCYTDAATRFLVNTSILTQFCHECRPECSSVTYLQRISSLSAPLFWWTVFIKQFIESTSVPLSTNWNKTYSMEINQNYVAFEVVCETSRIENYTQEISITGIDLLSNVGGHTGLWIGISFLSLMEFIEMFYRLIRYTYYVFKRRLEKITPINEYL